MQPCSSRSDLCQGSQNKWLCMCNKEGSLRFVDTEKCSARCKVGNAFLSRVANLSWSDDDNSLPCGSHVDSTLLSVYQVSHADAVMTGGVAIDPPITQGVSWYLPERFTDLPPDGVCTGSRIPVDEPDVDKRDIVGCSWPNDYITGTDVDQAYLDSLFGFTLSTEWSNMRGAAHPLAFKDFSASGKLKLETISANSVPTSSGNHPEEFVWEWVAQEKPETSSTLSTASTSSSNVQCDQGTCLVPMDSVFHCQNPDGPLCFISDQPLETECPEGTWGHHELILCLNGSTVWKKRCFQNDLNDLEQLLMDSGDPSDKLDTLTEIIESREGQHVSQESLEDIVSILDPVVQEFQTLLENITDSAEAFVMSNTFAGHFLSTMDEILALEDSWNSYNFSEVASTSASQSLIETLGKVGKILSKQDLPEGRHLVKSKSVLLGVTKQSLYQLQQEEVSRQPFYFPDKSSRTRLKIPAGYQDLFPANLNKLTTLQSVGYGKNVGLEVMGYVISALSIICLFINFLVFQFIDAAKTPTALMTKHLSITLLIGHLIMAVGFDKTFFFIGNDACSGVAIVLHYFFQSAFCWMLMEGYILYISLVKIWQAEKDLSPWIYLGFGYGFPLISVGVTIGISEALDEHAYGRGEYCWIRAPHYIWAFAGPVLAVLLANLVFMTLGLLSAREGLSRTATAKRQTLLSLKGCMSLTSILGLSWLLGYFYFVHSPLFAYVFTLLNASQSVSWSAWQVLEQAMFRKEQQHRKPQEKFDPKDNSQQRDSGSTGCTYMEHDGSKQSMSNRGSNGSMNQEIPSAPPAKDITGHRRMSMTRFYEFSKPIGDYNPVYTIPDELRYVYREDD
ncbi:unnamed protein product [Notodromas monacha]|uniref:G-protein coupled receptors family 2 profile 2 domain-containing protein n=1 Tax=Notodromas monacha TaxID=399045 RepID=A0A7R9BHL6_9CRUS|nr:unnamed protein product [Notodromas monacha]CAG0915394.1 unnamed protein product [Notodromas monacha]